VLPHPPSTPVSAEDELAVEQFNGTRSARRRILLAEELRFDGSDNATSQKDLAAVLAGLAESVRDSNQLDAAERLYGAAIRDDLAELRRSPETVYEPHPGQPHRQPARPARDRRENPGSLPRPLPRADPRDSSHRDPRHRVRLLKVSQGKFTTECINFLVEQGYSDDLAATLTRWQTEQNLRAPVLLGSSRTATRRNSPSCSTIITPRLLSAVFFAIDYEALQAATRAVSRSPTSFPRTQILIADLSDRRSRDRP